jgi:hypothetical protein
VLFSLPAGLCVLSLFFLSISEQLAAMCVAKLDVVCPVIKEIKSSGKQWLLLVIQ